MITADSSVWIDYLAGRPTPKTQLLDELLDDSSHDVVLLDVVLMEVLQGCRYRHEWRLPSLPLSALPVQTAGGKVVARSAAALYRQLRKAGVTVRSPIDLLVASWCMASGCRLIHNDRDFVPMQPYGLQAFTHETS
ncbi:MAG: PIN domain-containing protein [Chitinophagaceae bacterium]|nr:PIN domain-containing protein [Polaromonas sp.]